VPADTWPADRCGQVSATYHGPRTVPRLGARERYHKLSDLVAHEVTYCDEGPYHAGHRGWSRTGDGVYAVGQRIVPRTSAWRQSSGSSASPGSRSLLSMMGVSLAPRLVTAGGGVPMIDRAATSPLPAGTASIRDCRRPPRAGPDDPFSSDLFPSDPFPGDPFAGDPFPGETCPGADAPFAGPGGLADAR
jgi:hypothetical protein